MNRYVCGFSSAELKQEETDFLVIGSGVAGLVTALKASEKGRVLLLTKGVLAETNTYHAQGGIASAIGANDSPALHLEDTLKAGDGHCDYEAVKFLVEHGPSGIKYLIDQGVHFDREKGDLALTKEAAHCRRRILHADGDASGREVMRALQEKVLADSRIKIYEQAVALELLVKENICYGILAAVKNEKMIIWSQETVLATGGIGQLYLMTTNPDIATGDGLAMAYRAGAELRDLEFVQFHPTAFCKAGAPHFLISEAVRGEGAYLLNCRNERFMPAYHPLAELAPRDIVARAIFSEMKKTKHPCVYLSLAHVEPDLVKKRFPNLTKRCEEYGLVFTQDKIPVAPAAHYFMGGIITDLLGRTNIKNLRACGEVACTGVHGSNRLASNSLLEGVVFGLAIGENLQLNGSALTKPDFSVVKSCRLSCDFSGLKEEIHGIMSRYVGIVRDKSLLCQAKRFLSSKIKEFADCDLQLKDEIQLFNMLLVANLIADSAYKRKESRGAHYRIDYPEKNDEWAEKSVIQKISEGDWEYGIE